MGGAEVSDRPLGVLRHLGEGRGIGHILHSRLEAGPGGGDEIHAGGVVAQELFRMGRHEVLDPRAECLHVLPLAEKNIRQMELAML